MQYGVTAQVLEKLKIKKPLPGTETDLRFCWEVNYASICGKKLLIIVHADTRYGMVFCDIKPAVWKNFGDFMHEVVRQAFLREGFGEEDVEKYFSLSNEEVITKTHGRKAIGGLNHVVATLPFVNKELVEGMFQPLITAWINREPCCVSTHPDCEYFFPTELFVQEMSKLLRN